MGFALHICMVVLCYQHVKIYILQMALVRKVQRRGKSRYIAIPAVICDKMSINAGQHMMIHFINQNQIVYTKLDENLPVIQLEKEGE